MALAALASHREDIIDVARRVLRQALESGCAGCGLCDEARAVLADSDTRKETQCR